jgi:beta-phosphoglucomutase
MKTENKFGMLIDVDGTMVANRLYHQQAWIEFGKRHNLPVTVEYYQKHIHARGNEEILNTLYPGRCTPEFIEQASREKESLYRDAFQPFLKEIPGLITFLRNAKAHGVPCAAVSNSPKENVDFVIDGLKICTLFSAIVFREEVSKGKPDPAAYALAAQRMGIPLGHCIAFEDSPSGFKAAENAGIPFVAITLDADGEALRYSKRANAVHADFTSLHIEHLRAMVLL